MKKSFTKADLFQLHQKSVRTQRPCYATPAAALPIEPPLGSQTVSEPLQTVPIPATPAVKPEKPKTQRQPVEAIGAQARATKIFQAICQWNETPGRAQADKWCLSRTFLELQFGIHRQAVKEWFETHGSEVEAMHSEHGIAQLRTQNRGKAVTALKAFIASQNLEA